MGLNEGLAIGASHLGGVGLMGAYANLIKSAVVAAFRMVCALLNGAFNVEICLLVIHGVILSKFA